MLCHSQVSHKWLYHLDACAGSVQAPHGYSTNVQIGNRVLGGGQCRCCDSCLDPQLEHAETCSNAEATKEALRVRSRRSLRHETGRPWHYCGTQGAHCYAIQDDCCCHHRCCPGRSAVLDVCVASSIAAAARGEAAQAAFNRKLSHCGDEIGELRQQGMNYSPLVSTD